MERIANRYQLETLLAEDPLFSVYMAQDLRDNKKVTISLLSETAMKRPMENLLRFRKLGEELKTIKHPNIQQVLELGEDKGRIYTVNEVHGNCYLKNYKMKSAEEPVKIILGLTKGLAEAHQSRILHGAINSYNVLLQEDGRAEPVITCFGESLLCDLSKIDQKDNIEKFFGYLSPEGAGILRKPVDTRSDLYSLGIIFYELLTGRLPYEAKEVSELIHQHIAQVPTPPSQVNPKISPVIEKIILRMIAKDPADRYQSSDGLICDLQNYLDLRKEGKEGSINFEIARQDRLKVLNFNTRLIGREKELAGLKKCLNQSFKESRGKTVLVHGEPGIGKSRLVDELRGEAQVLHGIFAGGKCNQFDFQTPYKVITGALDAWIDKVKRLTQREQEVWSAKLKQTLGLLGGEVVKIAPRIKELIGEPPALVKLDSADKEKMRFLIAVSEFISNLGSKENPLILFLDDLQWVDEGSLEILERVMPKLKESPIFMIFGYRSTEVDENHILSKMLGKIREQDDSMIEEYPVLPFSVLEISHLISQILLEPEQVVMPMAKYLEVRTKGNPFFTLEMLRTLYERKLITLSLDKHFVFDLNSLNSTDLPANVVDIVLLRIKDIASENKKILSYASVMGKEINLEMLKELLQKSLDELVTTVESGIDSQLLYRDLTGKEEVFFIHDRVRESFYGTLSKETKIPIHKRIAEVMEMNYLDNLDEVVFNLAHHFSEGQVEEKALYYSIRGGDKAGKAYSNKLAIQLYTTAKNIMEKQQKTNTPEYINLLENLGEAQRLEGKYEEALANYKTCSSMVKQKLHKARLLRKMGDICFQKGDSGKSLEYLQQGTKLLGVRIPKSKIATYLFLTKEIMIQVFHTFLPAIFVRNKFKGKEKDNIVMGTMACLFLVYYFLDQIKTLYLNVRSMNMGERKGKSRDLAWAYSSHGVVLSCLGLLSRAKKYGEKGIQVSKDIGDKLQEYISYAYFGMYWNAANNPDKTLEYTDKAIGMLKNLGEKWDLVVSYYFNGYAYFYKGDLKKAMEGFENVLNTAVETKDARTTGWGLYLMEVINITQGKIDESCITNLKKSIQLLEGSKDTLHSSTALKHLGDAYRRTGEYKEAIRCQEKVVKAVVKNLLAASWINDIAGVLAESYIDLLVNDKNLSRKEKRATMKKLKLACFMAGVYGMLHKAHKGLAYQVKGSLAWIKGRKGKAKKLWAKGLLYLRTNKNNPGGDKFRIATILLEESKFLLDTSSRVSKKEMVQRKNHAHQNLLEARDLFDSMGCVLDLEATRKLLGVIVPASAGADGREGFTAKRHLDSLLSVTQAIGSVFKLEDLLEKIVEFALKVTGAECGFLMLYNDSHVLEMKVSKGLSNELSGLAFSYENYRMSLELIREVEKKQEAYITSQELQEDRIGDELKAYQVKQAMAVPLKIKEKLTGMLYLDNRLAGGTFGGEEKDLMKAFSVQASVSIENTRLVGNMVDRERLKQEMRIAERIQTAILPEVPLHSELEITAVMKTATEVGGDYYDILYGQNNKLWFSIGDVTGHGVTPGLIMLMAQTTFSSFVKCTASPCAAMKAVNFVLYDNVKERLKEEDYFMTMIFVKYEGNGNFISSGAAHPEMVVYRNKTGVCETIDAGGVFLCLEKDLSAHVEEKKFNMEKGDILFLYTDGITESKNKENKSLGLWGDERFHELIVKSVQQHSGLNDIRDNVLQGALEWCGNEPADDMTMVAVRMK